MNVFESGADRQTETERQEERVVERKSNQFRELV